MLSDAPATLKPSPGQALTAFVIWHPDYGLSWVEDEDKRNGAVLYETEWEARWRMREIGWEDGGDVLPVSIRVPVGENP